jgi:hypothetical protein
MLRRRLWPLLAVTTLVAPLCWAQTPVNPQQAFPDVRAVKIEPRGGDVFDFDVTISSPYDTATRYADAFRVLADDAKNSRVLGERILLHDHATEQPFTRELQGVKIEADIKTVTVQGRDKTNGYGGTTLQVKVPGR